MLKFRSKVSTSGTVKELRKGGEVDRVYGLLKNWILNCHFRPGDFLPEVEVANQCSTSRTPVREACNRLAEEKWLSKIPNRGYIVTPISVQEVVEIYEYRDLLESFAAERAAGVISQDELSALKKMIAPEGKAHPVLSEIVAANYAFHTAVAQLAKNQRVYHQLVFTLEYVQRLDILSTQRDAEWVGHTAILAALEAHDPKGAHSAMSRHIEESRDRMLRIFFRGNFPSLQPG